MNEDLQAQRALEYIIVCAGAYVSRWVARTAKGICDTIERQAGDQLDHLGPLTNPLSAAIN